MPVLEVDTWDRHEIQVFTDEDKHTAPHPEDSNWHKFTFGIEYNRARVDYWHEYVLFDKNFNPEPCVKIYLSDGKILFGRYKTSKQFKKVYDEFIKTIPATLEEIVSDLKGD
jgi:hypothetical protein